MQLEVNKRRSDFLGAMDQVRKFSKCLLRISRPNLKEPELNAFADKIVLITQDQVQKTSPKAKDGTRSQIEAVISSMPDQESNNSDVVTTSLTRNTLNLNGIPEPINDVQVMKSEPTSKETKKKGLKKLAATTKRIIKGGKIPYKELQDSKNKMTNQKESLENKQQSKVANHDNLNQQDPKLKKPSSCQNKHMVNVTKSSFRNTKKEAKGTCKNENKADDDNFKEFIKKKMGLKSPICPRYFKTLLETYKAHDTILSSKDGLNKKTNNEFMRSRSSRIKKNKDNKTEVVLTRTNSLPMRVQSAKKQNNLKNQTQQKSLIPNPKQTAKTSSPVNSMKVDANCVTTPRDDSSGKKRDGSLIPVRTPRKIDNDPNQKPSSVSNTKNIGTRSGTYIVEKQHKKESGSAKIVKPVSRIPRPKLSEYCPESRTDKSEGKIAKENNTMNISDLCSEFSKLDMMATSSPHHNKNRRESLSQFWPKVTVISEPRHKIIETKVERPINKNAESTPKRLFFDDENFAFDKTRSILGERNFNHTNNFSSEKDYKNTSTKGKENVYFFAEKMWVKCCCKSPKFYEPEYEEFDDFCVPSPVPKRRSNQPHLDELNDNVVFVEVFRRESNTLNLIYESQKKVIGVMEELLKIQARLNALKLKFSKPVFHHYYFL